MPDIAMCAVGTCPKSAMCYRHEDSGTKPSERQAWGSGIPGDDCPIYWPIKDAAHDRAA